MCVFESVGVFACRLLAERMLILRSWPLQSVRSLDRRMLLSSAGTGMEVDLKLFLCNWVLVYSFADGLQTDLKILLWLLA